MKSIGKYEVLEEIGRSVVGVTYRARDNFRKRELVLKVLKPLPQLDPAQEDEFCKELIVRSELTHRHVAKVLDLGKVADGIYIATELLSGTGLERLISEGREFTAAQKLGILAQVCEGLGFAHSRGIAHGAVKPNNLVLDHNNDVTIVDLGTAKWQFFILASGTRPDGLIPNYFAPEQILGQSFDSRSDLFSLALVSYEFLTGRYPFQVPASLIPREIVHSEPPPLRSVNAELPAELEELLSRMMRKNPDERLQTAEEFAAALYGIAQRLRRAPAAAAPEICNAAPEPVRADVRRADADAVEEQQGVPAAEEKANSATSASGSVKTPKRQDVQAGGVDAQPWTARSYAATMGTRTEERAAAPPAATSEPQTSAPAPATAAAPTPPPPGQAPSTAAQNAATGDAAQAPVTAVNEAPTQPVYAPVRVAPAPMTVRPISKPRIRPKPAMEKSLKRRVVVVAIGAVLAIYMTLNFVSRQGLHASQTAVPAAVRSGTDASSTADRAQAPAPVQTPAAPAAANPPVTGADPASLAEAAKAVAAEQFPRQQIKALWEAGNYADAMRLVDGFLVNNPASGEARVWKKRIRAAQEAEAAIK